jgi:hypothetical protein
LTLVLSPLLKIGVTLATLRDFGKIPKARDELIISERAGDIKSDTHFNTFAGNDFNPPALFFKLFMLSSTSEILAGVKKNELFA